MQLSGIAAARIRDAHSPVLVENWEGDARCHPFGDAPLVIGSAPDADILLPDLPARAVFVQRAPQGFEVFSFESHLGLSVEGVATTASPLANGQRLAVGGRTFLFVDPTADILPGGLQLALWGTPDLLPASPGARVQGDFNELAAESLAQVPWVLLSTLLHAGVALLLWLLSEEARPAPALPSLETVFVADEEAEEELVDLVEEEPEIEEPVETEEVPEIEESDEESESDDPAPPDVGEEDESDSALGTAGRLSGGDMGGGLPGQGMGGAPLTGQLKRSVGRLRKSGLDIVFLLDATASMDGEIASAKRRIIELIALLEGLGINFRIGVVAFRDVGDEYVTIDSPLTPHRYRAVAFLDRVEAAGGGDHPEAVTEAIQVASKMKFAHRADKVMILVGDAPPKEDRRRGVGIAKCRKLIANFQGRGGILHTVYADEDDPETRRLFADFATLGGGSGIELARDDQLIENVIMLALNSEDRSTVRALLSEADRGTRAGLVERIVRQDDVGVIVRQLTRDRLHPLLALKLFGAVEAGHGKTILPACFEVLGRRDTKLSTAWLCTVLMRREVKRITRSTGLRRDARRALREFHPELNRGKREKLLATLATELYDRGLLLRGDLER
jgi:Mg-chelatase subunit ChlD